ncbi:D-alanyl-D-alanine carboxypeptidase/D-alanyl-D-alanine-endopeptidase (penicillin-binding protein 4) [Lipingzhangella halophila]|uniref:D-alanyl-D-alanine carboxypeptidase/D-alanyl-D-alanine-endopeptidase (Penicillin-binding protein 4) n=1 Tax=Lipingzhangella halophila TaxID=1783352 RepID=A0A7W7RC63_9ACTN|nr:D-alanyl-D-alanine carboxypeptidase/D-alanyl-D-alanine-endopeptidase [Lipingzhangella halophila]MBB4929239.1 D-alanyl-D-alanine carboxypeptidase/D-alanyl-D-alanine-endopeptidase (penicillin-binding protein 4) [Lipingzhangella halophila]
MSTESRYGVRQVRARALLTLATLNVFVLVAGVVALDVVESRPPATVPFPAAYMEDAAEMAAPEAAPIDPDRLADKLDDPMSGSGLDDGLSAYVADAETGTALYDRDAAESAVPASTTKIVTAISVLHSAGPDETIRTSVVRGPDDRIILVGAGDPTLTSSSDPDAYPRLATLDELADQTADALRESELDSVSLGYDDSLFPGSDTGPGWKPNYVSEGSTAPVHALMLDGGRVHPDEHYSEREDDPPRATAEAFADRLREAGVEVSGGPSPAEAGSGADTLASVESAPISALVEKMMLESDNNLAEALSRQVAIAEGEEPSFEGAAAATRGIIDELGVSDVHVEDGSGLSVNNRITAKALAEMLLLAADPERPDLHYTLTGLPTAHFTGTLGERYGNQSNSSAGAGVVRGKTGTLSGVSTLAGTVYDANGRLVVFAFMANNPAAMGSTLDTFASAIAECGCS